MCTQLENSERAFKGMEKSFENFISKPFAFFNKLFDYLLKKTKQNYLYSF